MLSQRKTTFRQKLKSFDFWLITLNWITSVYVMGLGVLILLTGAWQGFVYLSLGFLVNPKMPIPIPLWVKLLLYILILLII